MSNSNVVVKESASPTMSSLEKKQPPPSFAEQLQHFDFRGDAIDMALRKLLAKVHLPKEAQEIDRAMEDFAKRYHECNPELTDSPDAVYAVAFSILLLHTDAHNKNVRQKMNKETFVMRTRIIEGGENVPSEILDIMFDNIVSTEFTFADSHETPEQAVHRAAEKGTSWFGRLAKSDSQTANSAEDLNARLSQLIPPENVFCHKRSLRPVNLAEAHLAFTNAAPQSLGGVRSRHSNTPSTNNTYTIRVAKAGIVERKYDLVAGGKKASARGWRPFGMILSGSQIIFFSDVLSFETWLQERSTPSRPGSAASGRLNSGSTTPTSISTMPFSATSSTTLSTDQPTVSSLASIYSTQSIAPNIASAAFTPLPPSPSSSVPSLRPVQIISLADAVCIYDESYTKYPHVFRLMTGDGQHFLIRTSDDAELDDWMNKINYAATIKTTGIRLRSSRHHQSTERAKREEQTKKKIMEISQAMRELERLLEYDLQLRRNLMVLVPFQKSTRERILGFAELVGKRVQVKRLQMQRLECYREYLEVGLRLVFPPETTRQHSAPFITRPRAPSVPGGGVHRSVTSPLSPFFQISPTPSPTTIPRSMTSSPVRLDDDDSSILWVDNAHKHTDDDSQESQNNKKKNSRRSSCPQIPPLTFTPSEDHENEEDETDLKRSESEEHLLLKDTDTKKDKTVAFAVPAEDKWTRRRSSSNPVVRGERNTGISSSHLHTRVASTRERSSSEASSMRDDDELTVVNVPVEDKLDDNS